MGLDVFVCVWGGGGGGDGGGGGLIIGILRYFGSFRSLAVVYFMLPRFLNIIVQVSHCNRRRLCK